MGDAQHEWHAARDMAHLTDHAGARQPCCEPILGRLSAIDPKHVRALQCAYFRRSPAWLAGANLPLVVGLELCSDARQRALATTPGSFRADAELGATHRGAQALRAATEAYEGRVIEPVRCSPKYGHDRTRERTVYFVRGEGTGLIKIGVADDMAKRFAGLAAQSPVALALLATVPGNGTIERLLHVQFAHLRAHGEWFREAPELLAYIESARAPAAPSTDSGATPPESSGSA